MNHIWRYSQREKNLEQATYDEIQATCNAHSNQLNPSVNNWN